MFNLNRHMIKVHVHMQPERNGLSRSWYWGLWFIQSSSARQKRVSVQQDWLKLNGSSSSFLHSYSSSFAARHYLCDLFAASSMGWKALIYFQWLQFYSAFPLMNVAPSIFFCCSPSAPGRWIWPVLTALWQKPTLLVPLLIFLHFRPLYRFCLSC